MKAVNDQERVVRDALSVRAGNILTNILDGQNYPYCRGGWSEVGVLSPKEAHLRLLTVAEKTGTATNIRQFLAGTKNCGLRTTREIITWLNGEEVEKRIVEELCDDVDCRQRPDTHWHPLSLEALFKLKDGEYSMTVRVRTVGKKR